MIVANRGKLVFANGWKVIFATRGKVFLLTRESWFLLTGGKRFFANRGKLVFHNGGTVKLDTRIVFLELFYGSNMGVLLVVDAAAPVYARRLALGCWVAKRRAVF